MGYKFFGWYFLLVFCSCKNNDEQHRKMILGTWDVYASEMNNKPNGFMKNAYFVFSGDNLVTSNLFPTNKPITYSVDQNRLKVDSPDKIDLNITRLDTDTMLLEGKLSHYYMKYYMARRSKQ